jgi:hypothetical protein
MSIILFIVLLLFALACSVLGLIALVAYFEDTEENYVGVVGAILIGIGGWVLYLLWPYVYTFQ